MIKSRKNPLEQDSTLRLIYAFNYYMSINESWEEESKVTEHNREIVKRMGIDLADDYFAFENRFYALNYSIGENSIIYCEIREYDNFYDMTKTINIMTFEFSTETKELNILSEKTESVEQPKTKIQRTFKAA